MAISPHSRVSTCKSNGGETNAIVGLNSAGKTHVDMGSVVGRVSPDSGQISVLGEDRGCEAARLLAIGHRLSGEVIDHVCCRHCNGRDRMLLTWRDKDHAHRVLVAGHDGSGVDAYGRLLEALAVTAAEGREKPQCCDDEA